MTKHTYTDEDGEWTAASRTETAILIGSGVLICSVLGLIGWIIWS